MLEIPESETLAAQLRETCLGRRIEETAANASPHGFAFYQGDPALYAARLTGRTIQGAAAWGGLVEIVLDDGSRLLFGDGARPRRFAAGEKTPKKHQLFLRLDDGAALCCTIQMYGGIWAYSQEEMAQENPYHQVAREKPSPLTEKFDESYFEELLSQAGEELSAKALLATQQRIPGLGNGCIQDILYNAGIHPKRKLSTLGEQERARMFLCVRNTLREMTALGGRDTEKDLFGRPGGYKTKLSKKTIQYPCLQCGAPLARQAYLGGNIYFCPHCQPL